MDDFRTLSQAAEELGVQTATLRQQIRDGRLAAAKLGGWWVLTTAEIDRYRKESLGKPGRK